MIMDIFICTEEAKGTAIFDIDCNTECWDNIHIGHATFASIALLQIIPVGMYIRVKYQEMLPDLNVLANPKFVILRTTVIILMIVLSKILTNETVLIAFLSAGMLSIVALQIIM